MVFIASLYSPILGEVDWPIECQILRISGAENRRLKSLTVQVMCNRVLDVGGVFSLSRIVFVLDCSFI